MSVNHILALAILVSASALSLNAEDVAEVKSPDGKIKVTVNSSASALTYSVSDGNSILLAPSPLGLDLNGISLNEFSKGFEISASTGVEEFDMIHGKRRHLSLPYSAVTLDCRGNKGRALGVEFRVFNDGVAFRYTLTNRSGYSISRDLSGFNIPGMQTVWAQEYKRDYSDYYHPVSVADLKGSQKNFCEPMLVKCGDDSYMLITEAEATSAMAASMISAGGNPGELSLSLTSKSRIDSDKFTSPWRCILIGSLPEIVESSVIQALNPASSLEDTSWILPGRMAWNWGAEDGDSAPTPEQARAYIDLAASMGWEYFLLDDGWDGRVDLAETAAYAAEKNVGLMIWSHQNRFANERGHIDSILGHWASLGIKGVKIDFFEDDSQDMLSKYEKILESAARYKLMVNFHGCTRPSGMERTYPHLMTSEAVLGGEFYMFNSTMTPASHGVNLALTRNVLGSMDYTPVKFGNKRGRAICNTAWAYQAALPVLFESSLLSFCDCPANFYGSIAAPMLRDIPVVWDDLKCLEAAPERYVSLARRAADDWWLASVSAENREVTLDLSFLDENRNYYAYIYSEGIHRSDIGFQMLSGLTRDSKLSFSLAENGGAAVILSPDGMKTIPMVLRREAEDYNKRGSKTKDQLCSGGVYVKDLNSRFKSLEFNDIDVEEDGVYMLTLFYLDNADHDAYLSINGDEKEYHAFKAVSSTMSGHDIAFVTIPVILKAGRNVITYGNDNGDAPALDRIVLTSYSRPVHTAAEMNSDTLPIPAISLTGELLEIESPMAGEATVFSLDGRRVASFQVGEGRTVAAPQIPAGAYILNISAGVYSVSKKFIK